MSQRHTMIRRLEFDYGHRLLRHEGKCRRKHGHRGVVEIACAATSLDDCGRVIDFGVVKSVVGGWIDEHLDHRFIVQQGDPMIVEGDDDLHVVDFPPTAEHLAEYLFRKASELLAGRGVEVVSVRFYETPNGSAVWPSP